LLNPTMMAEATRLVRAGRLAESTALLQRLVFGTTAPDTASASRRSSTESFTPWRRRMRRLRACASLRDRRRRHRIRPEKLSRSCAGCTACSIASSAAPGPDRMG
jgi:hypothetical protein